MPASADGAGARPLVRPERSHRSRRHEEGASFGPAQPAPILWPAFAPHRTRREASGGAIPFPACFVEPRCGIEPRTLRCER